MAEPERGERAVARRADPVHGGQRGEQPVARGGRRAHDGRHVAERPRPRAGPADAGGDVGLRRHVRIVVATTFAPFAPAPADGPADALAAACRAGGAEADRVRLPRGPDFALAARLTDVGGDRLVCLDGPAALLPHPARRVWLVDPAGLGAAPVRAALAAAPAVHAAGAEVRGRLAAAGVAADLLPVPGDGAAWARLVSILVR